MRVSYTHKSDGRPGDDNRYEYGGQDNTNNLMFYYKTFGIDLDEIQDLYYAGLLGKATAQLPASEISLDGGSNHTFTWTAGSFATDEIHEEATFTFMD